MGEVESFPPPAQLLQDVLKAEFSAAGHAIVDSDPEVRVMTEMRDFRLWTDPTILYWDVKAAVAVTVTMSDFAGRTQRLDHSASCRQRTYLWPGPLVMSEVVSDCLHQIGARLKGDDVARQFLNTVPEKVP